MTDKIKVITKQPTYEVTLAEGGPFIVTMRAPETYEITLAGAEYGGDGTPLPPGGAAGTALIKNSITDYDASFLPILTSYITDWGTSNLTLLSITAGTLTSTGNIGATGDIDSGSGNFNAVTGAFLQGGVGVSLLGHTHPVGELDGITDVGSGEIITDAERLEVGVNTAHSALVSGNPHVVTQGDVGLNLVENLKQLADGTWSFTKDAKPQLVTPLDTDILLFQIGTTGALAWGWSNSLPTTDAVITLLAGKASLASAVPDGGTTDQVLTKASNGNLDLAWADATGGGVGDHTLLTNIGTNTHAQIDTHIADVTANPHAVDKTDVGLGNVLDNAQVRNMANSFTTDFSVTATPPDTSVVLLQAIAGSMRYSTLAGLPISDATQAALDGLSHNDLGGLLDADHPQYTEKNGWDVNYKDSITLSFVDVTRTFSITPVGVDFKYWSNGTQYTKTTAQTVTITDTEGLWFIKFVDGTLTASQTAWDIAADTSALVAVLYWDATNNTAVVIGYELHSWAMDAATHAYNHLTTGSRYGEGFAPGDLDIDADGDDATSARLSIAGGTFWDEDIKHDFVDGTPQDLSPIAQLPVFYREGTAGQWHKRAATDTPFFGADAANLSYWNENTTGTTWSLTRMTTNDYYLIHIFVGNDVNEPVFAVMGQAEYTTITSARAGANTELADLQFGGLDALLPEFVPIASFIAQASSTYDFATNPARARFRTTDTASDYIDWRGITASGSGGTGVTSSDHGSLAGLADDDHAQYHNDTRGDLRYPLIAHDIVSHDTTATGANLTELTDGSETTLHSHAGGGGVSDHTLLTNIGTNTHAQIDTHIANVTTNPHAVTKTNVGLDQVTNNLQIKDIHLGFSSGRTYDGSPALTDFMLIQDSAGDIVSALTGNLPTTSAVTTLLGGKASLASAVPDGGTTGQVLSKVSASNLDIGWSTPATDDSEGAIDPILWGKYTLSADQTANLTVGYHFEYDTVEGSLNGLATGTGQLDGIITLTTGATYKLSWQTAVACGAGGFLQHGIYDITNSTYLGQTSDAVCVNYGGGISGAGTGLVYVTPTTDIEIEMRVSNNHLSNVTTFMADYSWLLIEEVTRVRKLFVGTTGKPVKYGKYTLSANQTSVLTIGNPIRFDTQEGTLGGIDAANYNVTLAAEKNYKITYFCYISASSGTPAILKYQLYDLTASAFIGKNTAVALTNNWTDDAVNQAATTIDYFSPLVDTEVEVRIVVNYPLNLIDTVNNEGTFLLIEEITLSSGSSIKQKMIYIEDPTATDAFPIGSIPIAATVTGISAVTDAGTVTFNVEKRLATTPATAGTDILTSDKVASTTHSESTGIASAVIASEELLYFVASAVASTPTKLWVTVQYQED